MRSALFVGVCVVAATFCFAGSASAIDILVNAQCDVEYAGQSDTGGNGILPVEIALPAGTVSLTFPSVTGTWTWSIGTGIYCGPDGESPVYYPGAENIGSVNGISGIIDTDTMFFLSGVFVGSTIPPTAPPTLDFTGDENFTTLSPLLDQQFFIGDGLTGTGTGTLQTFVVPAGAADLYLGVSAGLNLANGTSPSWYSDNDGNLDLSPINFNSGNGNGNGNGNGGTAVPEPATMTLLGIGLAGLMAKFARRKNR